MMNEDGTMMRFDGCAAFAAEHGIIMTTVEMLSEYRAAEEAAAAGGVGGGAASTGLLGEAAAGAAGEERKEGGAGAGEGGASSSAAALLEEAEAQDARFMALAVQEGDKGRITAPPNPWVGCVIVSAGGVVIGAGYHHKAGQPHAECMAVNDAQSRGHGDLVEGCTVYTTLAPCHAGPDKRTPPCDDMLVERKVARVCVAVDDPDPVYGMSQGLRHLEAHGIAVSVGAAAGLVEASLRPYLHQRRRQRPYTVVKVACSMDGMIGCADKVRGSGGGGGSVLPIWPL